MYQHLTNQIESIQMKAMQDMEKVFQKEFDSVFNDLCKLYPKRHIHIIFGNGTLCVKGFENLRTHMSLADSYGSLVNYSDLQPHIKQKFPSNHPLIKLMQLMDVCYYPSSSHGWTMALEDLKADPVENKLKQLEKVLDTNNLNK